MMAVRNSLEKSLKELPEQLQFGPLAEAARVLANMLDSDEITFRDAASISREFRATLGQIREIADAVPSKADPLDELEARRKRQTA